MQPEMRLFTRRNRGAEPAFFQLAQEVRGRGGKKRVNTLAHLETGAYRPPSIAYSTGIDVTFGAPR